MRSSEKMKNCKIYENYVSTLELVVLLFMQCKCGSLFKLLAEHDKLLVFYLF
jgi:hypothetical protein